MDSDTQESQAMLREYYEQRAPEYERVYQKPERQTDLALLRRAVAQRLQQRSVLDVACGTGYWMACYADGARRIVGVDASEAVLNVARGRGLPRATLLQGDALALPQDLPPSDGAFLGFWWSHIPRAQTRSFLTGLHRHLVPGARVLILDNLYVPGSSTPVSEPDENGDTWQLRRLGDDSWHRVLKNFPSVDELRAAVGAQARATHWWRLEYYWLFEYELA